MITDSKKVDGSSKKWKRDAYGLWQLRWPGPRQKAVRKREGTCITDSAVCTSIMSIGARKRGSLWFGWWPRGGAIIRGVGSFSN